MPISDLQAVSYQWTMESGRTKPCLFLCEDTVSGILGEYVVKLKAGLETRENGLAAELIASQLAAVLDLRSPDIAELEAKVDRMVCLLCGLTAQENSVTEGTQP